MKKLIRIRHYSSDELHALSSYELEKYVRMVCNYYFTDLFSRSEHDNLEQELCYRFLEKRGEYYAN